MLRASTLIPYPQHFLNTQESTMPTTSLIPSTIDANGFELNGLRPQVLLIPYHNGGVHAMSASPPIKGGGGEEGKSMEMCGCPAFLCCGALLVACSGRGGGGGVCDAYAKPTTRQCATHFPPPRVAPKGALPKGPPTPPKTDPPLEKSEAGRSILVRLHLGI